MSLYCKFCPWTPQHIFSVSAYVSRVCDLVYEEERSWSRVNRTVLRIYGAKTYQFLNRLSYHYPPRKEPVQKEERSTPILRHKFQKGRLTPQICATVLGPRFAHKIIIFLITKSSMGKNMFKNRFSIPIYLKIHHFLGTILL